jgi:NAD(P)-dependent dehydrogenase (short-subunit alcohol dehydrogenase family)
MSNTQAALAEAIETFGRIDILLCNTSEGKVSPTIPHYPL